jgi:hypothetical protein
MNFLNVNKCANPVNRLQTLGKEANSKWVNGSQIAF